MKAISAHHKTMQLYQDATPELWSGKYLSQEIICFTDISISYARNLGRISTGHIYKNHQRGCHGEI